MYKTKHESFRLYAFDRQKNKNSEPHKEFHIYKFEMQNKKRRRRGRRRIVNRHGGDTHFFPVPDIISAIYTLSPLQ